MLVSLYRECIVTYSTISGRYDVISNIDGLVDWGNDLHVN